MCDFYDSLDCFGEYMKDFVTCICFKRFFVFVFVLFFPEFLKIVVVKCNMSNSLFEIFDTLKFRTSFKHFFNLYCKDGKT